jgi:hypothetical protein
MELSIPTIIRDYFNAANQQDAQGVVQCFSAYGVVHDEGKVHQGHIAIGHWSETTSKQYKAIVEPLAVSDEGGKTIVTCRVSGNFPGSPLALTFAFVLTSSGIASLEITA